MVTPVTWPAPDLLSHQAESTPDRTALIDAGTERTWSYRELVHGPVAELAGGIHAAGLEPGDHLGGLVPPGIDVAKLLGAAARAGVVFVPLSPDVPEPVLEQRCGAADVDGLVVTESTRDRGSWFEGAVLPIEGLEGQEAPAPSHGWRRDEVQWLGLTSGTTGDPKAVQLTAGNLVASATASARRLGVRADDRWLACLPMHHVGGLAPFVRSALYGTTAVVQAGFDVDRTAETMARQGITGVSLVPTMLTRLLDAGWTPPESLRFVLLGGAPAGRELIERCEAADVPVHPTYGATETASQIATARPAEAFEQPGTVGRPLAGIDVGVRDGSGGTAPPGTVGELVVSGPVVSPGYYDAPGETADRFEDGTFHTRDRGYRDDAGRLWVVGRVDDAIVTGGENVHPERVADAIREIEGVGDVAVVGLPDEEWGERVAALVVGSVSADELDAHCRERLADYQCPKQYGIVDALPRTASGTVDREAVREFLAAD
jgi:O-succinylbenzoic acid--CoA ligase